MPAEFDFVAVGDVMLDVRMPAASGARLHTAIEVSVGGSAVNAALAAARRGARAGVVGRVGEDPVGRLIADELRRAGVEPLLELDPRARTGTAAYVGDAVVADRGANAHLEATELPPARATLVSGYAPHAGAILRRAAGLRGFDTQGLAHDVEADVLIGPQLDLKRPAADVVCTTLGADGAAAVAGDLRETARPPSTLAQAPVGAGDTFAAVFLLALANGAALGDALRDGCAAVVELVEDGPAERQERDTHREGEHTDRVGDLP